MEIKGKGDTVYINGVGAVAVRPYITNLTTGDAVTYDTLTDGRKSLEIEVADYFAFKVEDIEAAQANPKFVSEATTEAGIAMAKETDNYLYTKMYDAAVNDTADDFGQRGASSATNGGHITVNFASDKLYDKLVDAGVRLDDMLCPDDGRFVIVPSFAAANIRKDDRFVANGSDGQSAVRDKGKIGMIAGFDVISMPRSTFSRWDTTADRGSANAIADHGVVTGTTADDYAAIFGRKGAMGFAEQINKVENVRLEGYFADAVRGLHLYGAADVRRNWLGVLAIDDNAVTDA